MLNESRVKIYINAYLVRVGNGEKITDIDNDYLSINRLSLDDIHQIHKELGFC